MPAGSGDARRFWDARAREDACYFVDNRLTYGRPDLERFWAGGEEAVDITLTSLGLTLGPEDVVLDLGCGVGRLTRALAHRAHSVIALDVSAEMLARAQAANPDLVNVRWVHSDGTTLAPVADGLLDACLSLVVLQHIPDPAVQVGYVAEMARVLRPGGWAAFQVSTAREVHAAAGWRARVRGLARRGPRGQAAREWVGAPLELEAVRDAADRAGAEVERVTGAGTQFCLVGLRRRS